MDVYEAIYTRRDVREFDSRAVPKAALRRMLEAAHRAPSVGFMQPWSFVLIRDVALRTSVKESFERANARAAATYTGDRAALYRSLKLEGILDAPLNLCVTCDRLRGGNVLGRHNMPDTDVWSTCLAVQNLWLAARAERVGVGWVSIVEPEQLAHLLGLPESVVPVAYLCIGYPARLPDQPLLETVGWRDRLALDELVFADRYGARERDLFEP